MDALSRTLPCCWHHTSTSARCCPGRSCQPSSKASSVRWSTKLCAKEAKLLKYNPSQGHRERCIDQSECWELHQTSCTQHFHLKTSLLNDSFTCSLACMHRPPRLVCLLCLLAASLVNFSSCHKRNKSLPNRWIILINYKWLDPRGVPVVQLYTPLFL